MKICSIFAEVLYSFLVNNRLSEWQKSYNELTDIEFLESFFQNHESDLINGFYKGRVDNVTDAVLRTKDMARNFYGKVFRCCKNGDSLDQIFKSLNNEESYFSELLLTKAQNKENKCDWLRIYGLKVDKGVYSITGGTIKLTKNMKERDHTQRELLKLSSYKSYLQEESIFDKEGLLDYIENI